MTAPLDGHFSVTARGAPALLRQKQGPYGAGGEGFAQGMAQPDRFPPEEQGKQRGQDRRPDQAAGQRDGQSAFCPHSRNGEKVTIYQR